jgi:hypothetical protein
MGCWNETCGLTQLPIIAGDRAVLLFLVPRNQPSDGIFYHPHDLYKIIGLPLRGKYNDYGCIEDIDDTPASQAVLEYFQNMKKEGIVTTDIPKHEKVITFKNLDSLVKLIERGYVRYGSDRIIAQMMFHEKAYNAITADVHERVPTNSEEIKGYLVLQDALRWYNRKLEKKGSGFPGDKDFFAKYVLSSMNFPRSFKDYLIDDGEYWLNIIRSQKRKNLIAHMIGLLDLLLAMSLMRKMFLPQTGKGSQNSEMYLHTILANFVIDHHKKNKTEWLKYNGDDENKEPYKEYLFHQRDEVSDES